MQVYSAKFSLALNSIGMCPIDFHICPQDCSLRRSNRRRHSLFLSCHLGKICVIAAVTSESSEEVTVNGGIV